mgnify:FL=1|tara:strand:+ start:3977 stop:4927 length:951 start_codon:yes stop_codon:yes gene_type:complete
MDILFIGGTGFFGKAFLNYIKLNNPNYINSVTIVGRSAERFLNKNKEFTDIRNVNYIYGDILKDISYLSKFNFTHVIHAAADSTNVTELSDTQRYEQIVEGTKNVLNLVRDYFPMSKLLFVSSGGVYGKMLPNKKSFSETDVLESDILDSSNIYAISKREAEHLCLNYHDKYNLNISIARCFCFSGIHLPLDVHFAIGNFVNDVNNNNNIIIKGDGESVRSYLDQDDLIEWFIEILKNDSFKNTIYNIGSEDSISIKDLAMLIKKLSNKKIDVEILNESNNNLRKTVYVPDCEKIIKKFNLVQKVSLSESIAKMLN